MLANQEAFKLHSVFVFISNLRVDCHILLPEIEGRVQNLVDLL